MRRRLLSSLAAVVSLAVIPPARGQATAPPAAEELTVSAVVPLVPPAYRHRLVQQLGVAEDNQSQWLDAIARAPAEQREAVAYLLVNMPEPDLQHLKGDYLLKNVALAYKARAATPWAAAVPMELFLRDVLPYASLDERRDDWRQDFYDRFLPQVKGCKSAADAAQLLNRKAFPQLKVRYHPTKRPKPNQSPYESTAAGYASCTGLSVILVDACRAVGVPARVAGTPLWSDNKGNHTWTEVWDRQWFFVGAAEPGKLNDTWFVANAAKADDARPEHRIYAVDAEQDGGLTFPMVWAPASDAVKADDVTGYYVGRRKLTVTGGTGGVEVRQGGKLVAAAPATPATFELAAGQRYAVSAGGAGRDVELPKGADATVALP